MSIMKNTQKKIPKTPKNITPEEIEKRKAESSKRNVKPRSPGPVKRDWIKKMETGALLNCCICHKIIAHSYELTVDHIVPTERGGSNTEENLGPAHHGCNFFKSSMPDEVVQQLLKIYPDIEYWTSLAGGGHLRPIYKHYSDINKTIAAKAGKPVRYAGQAKQENPGK